VHASVAGRGEVKVRLIGIDSPETRKPGTPVQCYGPQATAAAKALLPVGTTVAAAFEANHRTDRYGRDLWDLWLPDGRFVNGALVAQGAAVARSYRPTTDHAAYLLAQQGRAQAAHSGLWGACPVSAIPKHD
jgi:micrococcal nuclease